jgi:putative SOS response-associated peptidase YedK
MCYDLESTYRTHLKKARLKGDEKAVEEIIKKLRILNPDFPYYHVSGFAHPKLMVYTNHNPDEPTPSTWGLVPHWAKTESPHEFWKKVNTLNAMGETIFEKASYRDAARNRRCILCVDAFYESHRYNNKSYPFIIYKKDETPINLGCLWSEWLDKSTGELFNSFSIVTTQANELMSKIHNNKKRMPLILDDSQMDQWLHGDVKELIKPWEEKDLKAHSVAPLRGKNAIGNVPEVTRQYNYPELQIELDQQ